MTSRPSAAEILQSDLAQLMKRDGDELRRVIIRKHPLIQTTKLAGGVTVKQATDRYDLNIFHTDETNTVFLRPGDTIVRTHVQLKRDGRVNVGVHAGTVDIDKDEEHLAYAMSAYLPEIIIMKALRRQPKSLTIHQPIDELPELIDFIDFTTNYGVGS